MGSVHKAIVRARVHHLAILNVALYYIDIARSASRVWWNARVLYSPCQDILQVETNGTVDVHFILHSNDLCGSR